MTSSVMKCFELTGKVAVITGAASGQGRASARLFAEAGARVLLVDRNAADGEAAAREIADAGGDARFLQVDLGDPENIKAVCADINEAEGAVDILFNNAAIGFNPVYKNGSIFEIDVRDWQGFLDINLTGAMVMTQQLAGPMRKAGRGSIIFNASIAALIGQPGNAPYSASKGGMLALMRGLAAELGPDGIRVNAIAPGAVRTPMLQDVLDSGFLEPRIQKTPLRRVGEPEEIAQVALFLASDAASFVSGITVVVDGGRTAVEMGMMPGT